VLPDCFVIEVALYLRRVVDDLFRQRRPHDACGLVDLGELAGQCVLRLAQPVLDDQEFTVLTDDVAELVAVDRDYLVSLHAPPSPRGNTTVPTHVRVKTSALVGWPT
jgi:hypothetical protein